MYIILASYLSITYELKDKSINDPLTCIFDHSIEYIAYMNLDKFSSELKKLLDNISDDEILKFANVLLLWKNYNICINDDHTCIIVDECFYQAPIVVTGNDKKTIFQYANNLHDKYSNDISVSEILLKDFLKKNLDISFPLYKNVR